MAIRVYNTKHVNRGFHYIFTFIVRVRMPSKSNQITMHTISLPPF